MATITLKGNEIHTCGDVPAPGATAPAFSLTKGDLSEATLASYAGTRLVLNVFPSIDTGVCATSVRVFNEKAAALDNTSVLCISRDLPFAQARFCGAEGIESVEMLSELRDTDFGKAYGVSIVDGPLASLLARAVIVIDIDGKVLHSELVPEIAQEPDYAAALAVL